MGPSDIKISILLKTIEKMPDKFYTKDVSNHQDMIDTHPELIQHSHYHSFVGKAIKQICIDYKGLNEIRKGTSRGSLWRKASSQEIVLAQEDVKCIREVRDQKVPLSERKWFKGLFIVSLIIGSIMLVFGWIFIIILILMILFFGSIMGDSWKEASKGKI